MLTCGLIELVGTRKRYWLALSAALPLTIGCGERGPASASGAANSAAEAGAAQAGFVDLAPRNVLVHGRALALAATSKIFYNFRPADTDAATRPLIVLFNGFASDVLRAFGTGPNSIQTDGSVVPNPNSLPHDARDSIEAAASSSACSSSAVSLSTESA